jgi:hypothetical protein
VEGNAIIDAQQILNRDVFGPKAQANVGLAARKSCDDLEHQTCVMNPTIFVDNIDRRYVCSRL